MSSYCRREIAVHLEIVLGFLGGSVGKESACKVGDLGSVPGSGRSPGEGKGYPLQYSGLENSMDYIVHGVAKSRTQLRDFHFSLSLLITGFPGGSAGKESPCNAGDLGSISGWGTSPGEGIGYPLQYSGLENSTDCLVHGVTKSQTRRATFTFNIQLHIGSQKWNVTADALLNKR